MSSSTTTTITTISNVYLLIAVALIFLLLLSTVLLASYLLCRSSGNPTNTITTTAASEGVILPRIIFVADDDHDRERDGGGGSYFAGLDQAVINSYPKFEYAKDGIGGKCVNGGDTLMCSICLCDYKEREMLRMMPECRHYFHVGCLDAWLRLNGSCPVCRNSPLPTPLSTPLSELVPLSQYAADRARR